jgi:8-oxo-dGTP diphosphatase
MERNDMTKERNYSPLVVFDYDGVLSKNPRFQWPLDEVDFSPITEAQDHGYAVAIVTCNVPYLVARELEKHGFQALPDPDMEHRSWHDQEVVLVTNFKLPAKMYVDDKGFSWHYGQDTGLIWDEMEHRSNTVTCSQDHRHWGRYGAAGLLLFHKGDDGQIRYLLQLRSREVMMPGTWSIPGGAINEGERPSATAFREFLEEVGWLPAIRLITRSFTDDHGGWSYHTIVAEAPDQIAVGKSSSWEADELAWVTAEEAAELPLHPGFAATFPQARSAVEEYLDKLSVILDEEGWERG